MLARVAARIYWLGRYLERAENTARLLNVTANLMLDLPRGTRVGWGSLVDITGSHHDLGKPSDEVDERVVVKFLLADRNHPSSIFSALTLARENARTTREIIPSEAWEQINDLYLHVKDQVGRSTARGPRQQLLLDVLRRLQQLTGLLSGTMSHGQAYNFIRLGRNLERADMTTRIVDVGSFNILPHSERSQGDGDLPEPYTNILWMSVLRSLSAYQMYRQHVLDRVNGEDVVTFLLRDPDFPRAVMHCLLEVDSCLQLLPNNDDSLRALAAARRQLTEADFAALLDDGLHDFVDSMQAEISKTHDAIAATWFLPMPGSQTL